MLKKRFKKIALSFVLFVSSIMYAHGDLSIRIHEKTKEISKDTTNSKLYFERGFLYQQHEEFNKALSDYLRSEELGNTEKLLKYRKAKIYFALTDYHSALKAVDQCIDPPDVKPQKLKAQILMKLKRHSEALDLYDLVIKNTLDIRPEDIVEYSTIFLAMDSTNYTGAIKAIDIGLDKLGDHVVTLQLKKTDYLKRSGQPKKVIDQYNTLITENTRKEFWYYKKAMYLFELNRLSEAYIALQQTKVTIEQLSPKFKSTSALKELQVQVNELEKNIHHEN